MQIPLLTDIVIIFALAVAVQFVFLRLRLPSVVGLLFTGIIAGPHGLGLVDAVHEVEVLAEIGVVLLLFTIGIEFSFQKLVEIRRAVLVGGALQVGLTIVAVFAVARWAGVPAGEAVFYGFLVSLSSTAIVLGLVQQRGEVDSPHGRITLGMLLFQDVIVVPMLLVTPFLAGAGQGTWQEVAVFAGRGLGIVVLVLASARWVMPWVLHQVARTRSKELFLLCVVGICLTTAWLTASAGLSLALGAFLAGLIMAESDYSHEALGNILPFRDVFTCFFFVSIGMLLDTGFLAGNLLLVLAGVVAVLALKGMLATVAGLASGRPLRTALLAALAVGQVGEFSFILSRTGMAYGLLAGQYQFFLAVAVLSMAATPFVIAASPRMAGAVLRLPLPAWLRGAAGPPAGEEGAGERRERHLIIIGFGLNGRNLARAAAMSGIPYVIVEMSPDTVRRERQRGEPIFYGDAVHEGVLRHAGIEEATVVVVAINDPAATRRITENARRLNPKAHIIVRTRYLQEMAPLYELGANEVIPEEFETSVEIFSRVLAKYLVPRRQIEELVARLRSDGYGMLRQLEPSSSFASLGLHLPDMEVSAVRVEAGAPAAGRTLVELALRKRYGVTVLAVRREGKEVETPEVGRPFAVGDTVYLMGTASRLAGALPLFGNNRDQNTPAADAEGDGAPP